VLYLVGLVVDLFLADDDALCVGEDREQVHQTAIVEHCALEGLAVDSKTARVWALLVLVVVLVVICCRSGRLFGFVLGIVLLVVVLFLGFPEPHDLVAHRLVDDAVEGLLIDPAQRALERRLAGYDESPGHRLSSRVQTGSLLVV